MKRALLVVDVQESFRTLPNWRAVSNPGIVHDVGRLVDGFRAAGETVIWVLHAVPGTGNAFDPVNGHVRLIEGLTPRPSETTLTKTAHNAFTTTNLHQSLTRAGIGEVVVCGIRTEQCCETTARLASDLGYTVTFVSEATATTPLPHRDAPAGRSLDEDLADPRTLGTAELIERTEYALAGRFAAIRTVADTLATAVPSS